MKSHFSTQVRMKQKGTQLAFLFRLIPKKKKKAKKTSKEEMLIRLSLF